MVICDEETAAYNAVTVSILTDLGLFTTYIVNVFLINWSLNTTWHIQNSFSSRISFQFYHKMNKWIGKSSTCVISYNIIKYFMLLQNSIFYSTKEKSSDHRENGSVKYYVLSKQKTSILVASNTSRPVYWPPVYLLPGILVTSALVHQYYQYPVYWYWCIPNRDHHQNSSVPIADCRRTNLNTLPQNRRFFDWWKVNSFCTTPKINETNKLLFQDTLQISKVDRNDW